MENCSISNVLLPFTRVGQFPTVLPWAFCPGCLKVTLLMSFFEWLCLSIIDQIKKISLVFFPNFLLMSSSFSLCLFCLRLYFFSLSDRLHITQQQHIKKVLWMKEKVSSRCSKQTSSSEEYLYKSHEWKLLLSLLWTPIALQKTNWVLCNKYCNSIMSWSFAVPWAVAH